MAKTLKVEREFPAPGEHLCGLAWDGKNLWHSDADADLLYCMDPHAGTILRTLACEAVRTGLDYQDGLLWQVAGHPKRICIVDATNGRVKDEIGLGLQAENICALLLQVDDYWTGPEREGMIDRYRLRDQKLIAQYGPVASADGLVLVGPTLWYTSYRGGILAAIDTEIGVEVERYLLPGKPTDMCWDGRRFWFNDYRHKRISAVRVDLT